MFKENRSLIPQEEGKVTKEAYSYEGQTFSYRGAKVSVQRMEGRAVPYIGLSISVPEENVKAVAKDFGLPEEGMELEEMVPICSFDKKTIDDLLSSHDVKRSGTHSTLYYKREESPTRGTQTFYFREVYPYQESILNIVLAAIVDAALNSKLSEKGEIVVDSYVVEKGSQKLALKAHFDYWSDKALRGERSNTLYVLSSPPTTVQFTGEYSEKLLSNGPLAEQQKGKQMKEWATEAHVETEIFPSSIMPYTLYRMKGNVLHASPWDFTASKENESIPDKRFFIKVFMPGEEGESVERNN